MAETLAALLADLDGYILMSGLADHHGDYLAALVRRAHAAGVVKERQACARIADLTSNTYRGWRDRRDGSMIEVGPADLVAERIRARGTQGEG